MYHLRLLIRLKNFDYCPRVEGFFTISGFGTSTSTAILFSTKVQIRQNLLFTAHGGISEILLERVKQIIVLGLVLIFLLAAFTLCQ